MNVMAAIRCENSFHYTTSWFQTFRFQNKSNLGQCLLFQNLLPQNLAVFSGVSLNKHSVSSMDGRKIEIQVEFPMRNAVWMPDVQYSARLLRLNRCILVEYRQLGEYRQENRMQFRKLNDNPGETTTTYHIYATAAALVSQSSKNLLLKNKLYTEQRLKFTSWRVTPGCVCHIFSKLH